MFLGRRGKYLFLLMAFMSLNLFAGLSHAQVFQIIPGWRYLPAQADLVTQTNQLIESESFMAAVEMAEKVRKEKKGTSEEGEARLVLAEICLKQGLLNCAFHYAITTATDYPGSMAGLRALEIVEKLVRTENFSEKQLQRLINSDSFKQVPESLLPMATYMTFIDNTQKSLFPWALKSKDKMDEISPGDFWGIRGRFLLTLEEMRRKKMADGIERLEDLQQESANHPKLAHQITLQIARLLFEKGFENGGDYSASLRKYESLPAGQRTSGQILIERAWAHYWQKEYAEALGLIKSIKSPFYIVAMDPEVYLLEILTLRKVCHFKAVKTIAEEFRKQYGKTIEFIRKRRPFDKNLELVRAAFMKASMIAAVETVSRVRTESKKLEDMKNVFPENIIKELKGAYARTEKILSADLDTQLRVELRKEAARFYDISDQIQLIDYLSGLDAFRTTESFEKKDYQAEEAKMTSFDTLFWPVTTEYWRDELVNYRVLIKDQCSEGGKK